jgi:hypothetical protein
MQELSSRLIELGRNMAFWPRADDLRARPLTSSHGSDPTGLEHLEEANRHVGQSERLVAGWRDLIDRMQAEGRDVTMVRDLLETFQGNLEAHRSKRDLIQRMIAQRRQ